MADETQNSTGAQLSSGASQLISGIAGEFSAAIGSWRGIIGLALILATFLVYSGKLPTKQTEPPKADNTEVLSAIANVKADIAQLKAKIEITGGELGKQLDELEVKTTAIVARRTGAKPKAIPAGSP